MIVENLLNIHILFGECDGRGGRLKIYLLKPFQVQYGSRLIRGSWFKAQFSSDSNDLFPVAFGFPPRSQMSYFSPLAA